MNRMARRACDVLTQGMNSIVSRDYRMQQWRGIRVKVRDGNLEQALKFMQNKMHSSGIERIIKNVPTRHFKNSEKKVLARKNLERKIQSQALSRKLQVILSDKVRGL